ncbi:MAG: hypothetical protein LBT31_06245 [Synergistaceae bacterium]|nr:hypothetical protein [Synergistaceae bacterium]
MDKDDGISDLLKRMEELERGISSLRESISNDARGDADATWITSLFDNGLGKIRNAMTPDEDGKTNELIVTARAFADEVGKKIAERPLASISLAIGAGYAIGRIASAAFRPSRRDD